MRRPHRAKWETVHDHLRAAALAANHEDNQAVEEHLYRATQASEKWPNARSREETAFAANVVHVIQSRLGGTSSAVEIQVLADLVAREARLRVVSRAQTLARRRFGRRPSQAPNKYVSLRDRLVRTALVAALGRLRPA